MFWFILQIEAKKHMLSSVSFIHFAAMLKNQHTVLACFLPKMDQLKNVSVIIKISGYHDTWLFKHRNPTIDKNRRFSRILLPSNQNKGAQQAYRSQSSQPNTQRRGVFWTGMGRKRKMILEAL